MAERYVHVTFRLVGDSVDPDQISSQLQLSPSSTHRKGDPLPRRPDAGRRTGFWGLDSTVADTEPLETHLRALTDVLAPKRSEIQQLVSLGNSAELYCSYIIGEDHGTLELSPDTLTRIGSLPARVVIATYCLADEGRG